MIRLSRTRANDIVFAGDSDLTGQNMQIVSLLRFLTTNQKYK